MRALCAEELYFISGGAEGDAMYDPDPNDDWDPIDVNYPDYTSNFDSMIETAVNANAQWLKDNPVAVQLFQIGDFKVGVYGSATEGIMTALHDCLDAGSIGTFGNDLATRMGWSVVASSDVGIIACTYGVGIGIIRDLGN